MRRSSLFVLMALLAVSVSSCRAPADVARRPGVVREPAEAPPPPPVRPGEVLTSADMERLRRERSEMIARPTPLGEESDAVARLRRGASR